MTRVKVKRYDDEFDRLLREGRLLFKEQQLAKELGKLMRELGLRKGVFWAYDRELGTSGIFLLRPVKVKRRKRTKYNGSIFDLDLY